MLSLMGSYRICVCFTRRFRVTEKEAPVDVKEAFTKYAHGGSHMTPEQLSRFLVEFQSDDVSDAEKIVDDILKRRHHIAQFTRRTLTLDDFHHYLFSAYLNPPITSQVHQDMTAPMSHYFIYTGHNSYLTGNQLSSDCSDVPIIRSLNAGVRAVELDVWPNSTNDNILVLHGRTLTTPVELIKCLESIKKHAFSASPYPLIITLEDHLNPHLRQKVAQMIAQTFGDMLFYPDAKCLKEFPSPEDLKYRVIISTKPPKEYLEAKTTDDNRSSSPNGSNSLKGSNSFKGMDSSDDDDDVLGKDSSEPADDREDGKSDGDSSNHNQDEGGNDSSDQDLHLLGTSDYARLIAIHAGTRKGGLKQVLKVDNDKIRRLSLNEQLLEKAAASHGTDVVRFTQKNFLRIYPKSTRFNSSNYKPHICWMHGAQMVAFNMQGYGRSLWLMHGMFRANGGCGYVKKPDFLMKMNSLGEVFDPKLKLPVKKTLKVRVYMGDGWNLDFKKTHFDAYSPPDFYVKVGIAGMPADEVKLKTKVQEDDWAPVWNEEFTFPLTVPELALLQVRVGEYNMAEKNNFGGQTCLPVSELRPGIYAVPLMNRKGDKFSSVRLLMRFQFV